MCLLPKQSGGYRQITSGGGSILGALIIMQDALVTRLCQESSGSGPFISICVSRKNPKLEWRL